MMRLLLSLLYSVQSTTAVDSGSSKDKKFTVELDSTGTNETLYTIDIDVGTPPQSFSFVLDSTFPQVAVAGSQCVDCSTYNRFQWKASSSFRQEEKWKIGNATGLLGTDTLSLSDGEGVTVSRQPIFVVGNDPGNSLSGSGILGLSHSESFQQSSFVQRLKDQRVISKAVVALFFGKYTDSMITFGGWDLDSYATRPMFTYIDIDPREEQWAFQISSVSLGPISLQSLPQRAVIDTASPNLIVPQNVYDEVKEFICRRVPCLDEYSEVVFVASKEPEEGFFSLTFNLKDQEMSISSEFYLKKQYRNKKPTLCRLAMKGREGEEWVLGLPFLQRYYVLLDFENSRFGFAPALQDDSLPAWFLWLLVGAATILIASLGFMCYMEYGCCCCCKQASELTESLLRR